MNASAIRFMNRKGQTRWQPQIEGERLYWSQVGKVWVKPTSSAPVLYRSRRRAVRMALREIARRRRQAKREWIYADKPLDINSPNMVAIQERIDQAIKDDS